MDDVTQLVLACQAGRVPRKVVEDRILVAVFEHLRGFRRNDEDDISGFLLDFQPRIASLVDRWRDQGVPFHHYLLRTVRWQWTTWKGRQEREQALGWLLQEPGCWDYQTESAAEPGTDAEPLVASKAGRRRLVLLALKAAPFLGDGDIERLARVAGVSADSLAAQVQAARDTLEPRRRKNQALTERQGEVYLLRLLAEDQAQKEPEPSRRQVWEARAKLYRQRLANLQARKKVLQVAPTHLDLAKMLGIPKGTVDSGLFHLKKELADLYTGAHDAAAGHEQRAQKGRARKALAVAGPSPAG